MPKQTCSACGFVSIRCPIGGHLRQPTCVLVLDRLAERRALVLFFFCPTTATRLKCEALQSSKCFSYASVPNPFGPVNFECSFFSFPRTILLVSLGSFNDLSFFSRFFFYRRLKRLWSTARA